LDSFTFFILRSLSFAVMFFLSTWILIPKAVFYYSQWKSTGKSKFLSAASACFAFAALCLATDLVMFVLTFIRSV
ncbi:MAG TPA: hypothetical protein DCE71_02720, partial [Parachlamydiales bacterium]|nr:hypothetical protein [Parachlamydiales bacterium]